MTPAALRTSARSLVAGLAIALLLGGCQLHDLSGLNPLANGHAMTLRPVRGAAREVSFDRGYYSFDQRNNLTIVLLAGDEANPRAAATIRLYWRPQVGATPMDHSATNTSVRYIVLEEDGAPTAAVYGGGGFLNPATSRGQATFRGDLVEASLRLVDAPPEAAGATGFDAIGPFTLSGPVTAERDDVKTQMVLRQLQQRISERLGYPRLVMR